MPQVRFKLALSAADLMLPLLLHAWLAALLLPVLPLLLGLLLAPPLVLLPVALSCTPAPCAGVAAADDAALRAGAMASVSA
jgi:hypothetical protein